MSSAVIGVAGTVALGVGAAGVASTAIGASAAAGATKDATNAAIAQQQSALNQQAALSAPYRALGESAIPTLQGLLGIAPTGGNAGTGGKGGASPQPGIEQTLANTPGYQFAKDQGLTSTLNAASAAGMGISGNTLEGLDKFTTGLADQTYQQQIGNYENLVNTGQAAAAQQAVNTGNAAANTSNLLINQGNTMAGIDANLAAGITKSLGAGANQYTLANTLQGLNNPVTPANNYDPTYNPYGPGSVGTTTLYDNTPAPAGGALGG